jgi:YidC/Oxa1 family membrane protein insertase
MDRTGIIVISICVALLGWWFYEQNQMQHAQARYAAAHPQPVVQTSSASVNPAATAATATAAPAPSVFFPADANAQTLVLTNGRARYTFTSAGGGLKTIELLDHPETISARWRGQITNSDAGVATLNAMTTVPVLAVLGDTNFVGDGRFELSRSGNTVRAEKNLADGLRLTKTFTLTSNFLVNAAVKIENTSDKTVLLSPQEIVVGTAAPMDADDSSFANYGGVMWCDGTNAVNNTLTYFDTNTSSFFGLMARKPTPQFRAGSGNVVWAAAHNQFFVLLAMPQEPAREIFARPVTLPRFQNTGDASNVPMPQGIQTALIYPSQTLAANAALERNLVLFAGPKEYQTLAVVADQFHNHADEVMNFGSGFQSFWGIGTFFAKLLLSAMNAIHNLLGLGYGWTIVILTFLLRLLFWPLTKASTISMKRMQALQPQMTALKEKYKDDQQKFMQKQMELWKQNKVSPMSGCWPMLMQMPVFMGFYTMIRSAIELRGASFLWAADLSKTDTVALVPGLNFPINPLPLLMGVAMLWQSHLMPASPGMDPAQQKMMRWMPGIFIVILYNFSAGLALYMTVSTLLGILQTKMTKNIQVTPAAPTSPLTPAAKKKK